MERFEKSFTQQAPLPEAAIEAAVAAMRRGALHRYGAEPSEAAALEREFAAATGARHALAVASGGYAIGCALRALGVGPGDAVLTNAWTLAPVPGAVAALGARPVLVETTEALTIDVGDLERRLDAEPGARVLLLSHMRGHMADMGLLTTLCAARGVAVVEDCAHAMGAAWDGVPAGRWGAVGCFSTQSYKHLDSGEGGLVATDDADLAARMILASGAYRLHARHGAAPGEAAFARHLGSVPNVSGRMDELRAALLRPQLAALGTRAAAWNERYRALEAAFRATPGLATIDWPARAAFVGSSIQALAADPARVPAFRDACAARGVAWTWYGGGASGYASTHRDWAYVAPRPLPRTDGIMARLLDMRVPLSFDLEDCAAIGRIVAEEGRRHLDA